MYNFNLNNNEEIIKIFDEIYIKQDENEKITTIILTNQRLLFLDHIIPNESQEVLRIANGLTYIKEKDVYYEIMLKNINKVTENDYYKVILSNNNYFEFNNIELYNFLKKVIQEKEVE